MAKGKKKQRSKDKRGRDKGVAKRAMLGTFAGGVVGKVIEKIAADTIRDFIVPIYAKNGKHDDKHHKDGEDDVAAKLLTALAEGGPKPIPQLLADTRLGLSSMLHALHTLRDFRLINFVGEPGDETVEATRAGTEAVTVLRAHHIRDEATKMLAD